MPSSPTKVLISTIALFLFTSNETESFLCLDNSVPNSSKYVILAPLIPTILSPFCNPAFSAKLFLVIESIETLVNLA